MSAFEIALVILVVLLVYLVLGYNRLVRLRNTYRNAFAQIDVQLQRRYDLIPNLVEAAKAYLVHERETLEAVVQARQAAQTAERRAAAEPGNPRAMGVLTSAEGLLDRALGRFFALVEAYPDLEANQTMADLSEELTSTENRVAFARQAYNDGVMSYNTARESLPIALVARSLGFGPAALYQLESPEARKAPAVGFG